MHGAIDIATLTTSCEHIGTVLAELLNAGTDVSHGQVAKMGYTECCMTRVEVLVIRSKLVTCSVVFSTISPNDHAQKAPLIRLLFGVLSL